MYHGKARRKSHYSFLDVMLGGMPITSLVKRFQYPKGRLQFGKLVAQGNGLAMRGVRIELLYLKGSEY